MSGLLKTQPSPTPYSRPVRTWRRKLFPFLLLSLCCVLFYWRLGFTPREDFDEAYDVAGTKEMLERGDPGIPYYNGEPFLLKPILNYWLIAITFRLLGSSEFAACIGSAFLGIAVMAQRSKAHCFAVLRGS